MGGGEGNSHEKLIFVVALISSAAFAFNASLALAERMTKDDLVAEAKEEYCHDLCF